MFNINKPTKLDVSNSSFVGFIFILNLNQPYMKKKYLFTLVALFIMNALVAKEVSQSVAQDIAQQFYYHLFPSTRSDVDVNCHLVYTGQKQTRSTYSPFYVYNYDNGFAIVAGNDLSTPILAYSTTGSFVTDNMLTSVAYWMNLYELKMEEYASQSGSPHPGWEDLSYILSPSTRDGSDEKLLSSALWYQYTPYNKYCPTIDGDGTATGCVATAFSIAMKFHNWPDKGTGSYSYEWDNKTLSANFDVAYQWDDMLNEYITGKYTDAQGDAVATLMYHVGVFSQMDYGTGGSGAHTINAVKGIVEYMKYDKGIMRLERGWYEDDEWVSMLKAEINDNRVVVYGGYDPTEGGHQFLFDGYRNDYFHVNWGWNGSSDGYYLVSDLNPFDREATSGGFSNGQGAVFYLMPETANSTYNDIWVFGIDEVNNIKYVGLTTETKTFTQNVEFNVTAGVYFNQSIRSFTGDMCIMLCDKDGTPKEDVSGLYSISDFPEGEGSMHTFVCKITQTIENGDYICLMFKSSDSDTWKMVIGGTGITTMIDVYNATAIQNYQQDEDVVVDVTESLITIKSNFDIKRVSVCRSSGELIMTKSYTDMKHVDINAEGLMQGIYILRIETQESIYTRKFVR